MIIERISVNQIKFTLSSSDLQDRNIKLTELAYGTEKTQSLFREMMDRANSECGFDSENAPLLIEAVPITTDSIVIIVTKVTNAQEIEEKFSMLPRPRDSARFKPKGLIENKPEKTKTLADENILIYSFANLDDVSNVSTHMKGFFNGTNILFKNDNKFYLYLERNTASDSAPSSEQDTYISHPSESEHHAPDASLTFLSMEDIDSLMSEFGQKHVSTAMSKHFLLEHGEVIIKHPALYILSKI